MSMLCNACGFPTLAREDIYCSGCGSRVLTLQVSPAKAVFYSGVGDAAGTSALRVTLHNRGPATRSICARSKRGKVVPQFANSRPAVEIDAGDSLELTLLRPEHVGASYDGPLDEIEIVGELNVLATLEVVQAPPPSLRFIYSTYENGAWIPRSQMIRASHTMVELTLPGDDGVPDGADISGGLQTLRVEPVGNTSLSLLDEPLVEGGAAQHLYLRVLNVPEGRQLSEGDGLRLGMQPNKERTNAAAEDETTITLNFEGLGERKITLRSTVRSQLKPELRPLDQYLDEGGALSRHSSKPARLRYEIRNNNGPDAFYVSSVELRGVESSKQSFALQTPPIHNTKVGPGGKVDVAFSFTPRSAATAGLKTRSGGSCTLLSLEFEVVLHCARNLDGAEVEEYPFAQRIDLREAEQIDLLALDFGTSNTCVAVVRDVNALDEELSGLATKGESELLLAPTIQVLEKHIEPLDLDTSDSLGFELPSVLSLIRHADTNDAFPAEIFVGEKPLDGMFKSSRDIRRTGWMMKRGLPNDGFGRTLVAEDGSARLYRWSQLVSAYLSHAFRNLHEEHGVWPRKIVFSFPATWEREPAVRELLEDCIRQASAGFSTTPEVAQGISEAEALAVYYANDYVASKRLRGDSTSADVVIFDCGGGTTDVAILRVRKDKYAEWHTDRLCRASSAIDRGGEDLTFEYMKVLHENGPSAAAGKSAPTNTDSENEEELSLLQKMRRRRQRQDSDTNEAGEPAGKRAKLPKDIFEVAQGANMTDTDMRAFGVLVHNARLLKHSESYDESVLKLYGDVELVGSQLKQAGRRFVEALLKDALLPELEAFQRRHNVADETIFVVAGNTTRYREFTEIFESFVSWWREQKGLTPGVCTLVSKAKDRSADERKTGVVKGVLIDALMCTAEFADGKENPLAERLVDARVVQSAAASIEGGSALEQGATATQDVHLRVHAGAVVQSAWVGDGIDVTLQTRPVRVRSAELILYTAESEREQGVEIYRIDPLSEDSPLREAIRDAEERANGGIRMVRFTLRREAHDAENDELLLSWEATRHAGFEHAPGGPLVSFRLAHGTLERIEEGE